MDLYKTQIIFVRWKEISDYTVYDRDLYLDLFCFNFITSKITYNR